MANGYNKNFTLTDIFNNPKLKGKIPLVNYAEKLGKDNKVHKTTKMQTLTALVYETAKNGAKPFYKPLKAVKSGNTIIINGKLELDLNSAYNGVYKALVGNKSMFSYTVNNADMIRTALKEAQKVKAQTGVEPKLWLKYNSMYEIESLNKKGLYNLINSVMQNIFYGADYISTQNKYGVEKLQRNYERNRQAWLKKVGEL